MGSLNLLNKELPEMKYGLTFIFLLWFSINTAAQSPETIYQGTVIATGFRRSIPLDSDGPYPVGFNFTFFGNSYSEFYVSANGLVMFTDPDGLYNTEATIPTEAMPNNFIAPFWDNLSIIDGGKILYRTIGGAGNRKCIIQFMNMGFDPVPTPLGTFQVILYETTNIIQIQYRLITDPYSGDHHGGSATIGLENSDGTAGVTYAYHENDAVSTGDAIAFTPNGTTYTYNPGVLYDGVYLTTNLTLPDPEIATLINPSSDAVIGSVHTFEWSESDYASSYYLLIDTISSLATASYYYPGNNLTYDIEGLLLDRTYYWTVYSTNSTASTWSETKRFSTSSLPPLAAVPQTIWAEQGYDKIIKLQFTGGDAGNKTAVITTLPVQGHLYQFNGGVKGAIISSVPATVTDAGRNVIYFADGDAGKNAGNFNFKMQDGTGDSPDALMTVNVSPPGIPNLLYTARGSYVELQFDRIMSDPAGKQSQFAVSADGTPLTVTAAALKQGDPYTIILTLNPSLSGGEAVLVSYTPGDITSLQGGFLLSLTDEPVTLLAQTIAFTQSLEKKLSDSPFTLTATASSGSGLTYSSSVQSVATISGNVVTLHSTGSSEITARQAGNTTYAPARFIKLLTVTEGEPVNKTLNLTSVLLQGLYNGSGTMRQAWNESGPQWPDGIADHITVELHNSTSYSTIVYTATDIPLSTAGTASVSVPAIYDGTYYITIRHRNSVETTTASPISFNSGTINQSFGVLSNVYGSNLKAYYDGYYLIYGGDVNQDGFVDSGDYPAVVNGNNNYASGYLSSDIDGSGYIDSGDFPIVINNNYNYIGTLHP